MPQLGFSMPKSHIFPEKVFDMKLHDLSPDERPREKMLIKGAASLSNAELIAIMLRSGTDKANVLDVAREMLARADNSLNNLSSMSIDKMIEIPGIGRMKAVTLAAAFELGRRFLAEASTIDKRTITGAEMIYDMMLPFLKGLPHEEFWVIWLNRANYVIGKEKISTGGYSSTTIDPKMIVAKAIEKKASGVIMVHNHPSGNPRPGKADIKETANIKKALEAIDVSFLDHIVVCDDCYFSFADDRVTSNRPTAHHLHS